jgi:hypothetical protein
VPEILRTLGLLTALPGGLVIFAMGLAQLTQTSPDAHNWTLFIIGGALLVLSVPPLLFGSSGSEGRTRSDRGGKRSVPTRAR